MIIDFQNENLVANLIDEEKNVSCKAIVPELISILDIENYEAIMTEDYKYGLRVICVTLPADALLLTEQALKICGSKAFGY